MEDLGRIIYGLAAVALVLLIRLLQEKKPNLAAIPTVGPSGLLSSYYGGLKYLWSAPKLMQEGYEKHKDGIFKVATINYWLVVVAGTELVEEVRKMPEDTLSFTAATTKILRTPYTLGLNVHENLYIRGIIRTQLIHDLSSHYPDLHDEILTSFHDLVPVKDNGEWLHVSAFDVMTKIICRASNRIFVGLPLCRDPDYTDLIIRHTIDVIISAVIINQFPTFLHPFAARLCTRLHKNVKQGMKHLAPLLEECERSLKDTKQDWGDKPSDFISQLVTNAPDEARGLRNMTLRIMAANLGSIHSASVTFVHVLHDLAANPEYADPMREEVETVVEKEGWTRESIGKMRKLDSFIRESQRFNGTQCMSMIRRAVKPFTFSNGVEIPAGTIMCAASSAMHHDDANYSNANTFEGFRFIDDGREGRDGIKNQLISTAPDSLSFGHGRQSCPGRFFAATEMKTMLAHIVMSYDVKFENEGVRPPNRSLESSIIPDTKASVLFRKREVSI